MRICRINGHRSVRSRSLGSTRTTHCSIAVLLSIFLTAIFSCRNKQGQTRFSKYYEWLSMEERVALESEIIRKCLSRSELQCSFLEYRGHKVVYRRYASLFFIAGTKPDLGAPKDSENNENEMGMLEFIHTLVETMDKWAGSITELDIM